jgi:transcriptional regulator with XRE-family HTH domain
MDISLPGLVKSIKILSNVQHFEQARRENLMRKIGRETLSEYVRRIIKEKDLKLRDVERRSGGQITNGYISGIMNGKITNLSVDKLKALATGLEADAHEIFAAAIGEPRRKIAELSSPAITNAQWLVDIMQEIVASQELMDVVQDLVNLSRDELAIVSRATRSLNERANQAQGDRDKRMRNKKRA